MRLWSSQMADVLNLNLPLVFMRFDSCAVKSRNDHISFFRLKAFPCTISTILSLKLKYFYYLFKQTNKNVCDFCCLLHFHGFSAKRFFNGILVEKFWFKRIIPTNLICQSVFWLIFDIFHSKKNLKFQTVNFKMLNWNEIICDEPDRISDE